MEYSNARFPNTLVVAQNLTMCWLPQVHAAIRADPNPKPKERKAPGEKKKWKQVPLTYDERKDKLKVRSLSTSLGSSWTDQFSFSMGACPSLCCYGDALGSDCRHDVGLETMSVIYLVAEVKDIPEFWLATGNLQPHAAGESKKHQSSVL